MLNKNESSTSFSDDIRLMNDFTNMIITINKMILMKNNPSITHIDDLVVVICDFFEKYHKNIIKNPGIINTFDPEMDQIEVLSYASLEILKSIQKLKCNNNTIDISSIKILLRKVVYDINDSLSLWKGK